MVKLKKNKKVLIAAILTGVLVFGAIISLVLVLAAPQHNVRSNIKVSYLVDGVGASVSAKYHVVNPTSGIIASSVNLTNDDDEEQIDFGISESETTKELNNDDSTIEVSSTNSMIVYEYAFTNNTESPFMVSLVGEPNKEDSSEVDNMTVSYRSSGKRLTNFTGDFADSEAKAQLVLSKDQTIYVYIAIRVKEINFNASYNGTIEWLLNKVDEAAFSTLTLDNVGGNGGQTEIKYIAQAGVQLPHLTSLPKSSGTTEFMGYKNSSGEFVYDINGNSLTSEAETENITYTAEWIEAYQVSATGELSGLMPEAQSFETLNIPESVTTINSGVFNNTTTSATTINIPSSVTTIGESAFEGNTVVENIIMDDGTAAAAYAEGGKIIGANAFKGCTALKSLIVSDDFTSFGVTILSGCNAVESLTIPYLMGAGTSSVNGLSKLFGSANSDIPKTIKNVEIISGEIGNYAFYKCSNLTSVIIGDGVTSIGNYAFYNCTELTTITIPSSISSVGNYPLGSCYSLVRVRNLSNLDISDYGYSGSEFAEIINSNIPFSSNISSNGNYLIFTNGSINVLLSLIDKSVTAINDLPNNLTYINSYLFKDLTTLESIMLPASLKGIGDYAFYNCKALTTITIPSSVTSIGNNTFYNCKALTSITIPSSVTSIGEYAFNKCTGITQVSMLCSEAEIGLHAFRECTNITRVDALNLNSWLSLSFSNYSSTPLYYAKKLYINNQLLTDVTIPDSITEIKDYTFYNVTALKTVNMSNNILRIGSGAFKGTGLTTVIIPDSVSVIDYDAFKECASLTSVSLGSGLLSIGGNAFHSCKKLTSVNIPSSVTIIDGCAFAYCSALTSIIIPSSVTTIGSNAFFSCSKLTSVEFDDQQGWNAYSGTTVKYSNLDLSSAGSNASKLKSDSSWGYYELRKTEN